MNVRGNSSGKVNSAKAEQMAMGFDARSKCSSFQARVIERRLSGAVQLLLEGCLDGSASR